jgi:hypothetical protein
MFNFKKIAQELNPRTLKNISDDFNKNLRELINFLRSQEDLFYLISSFISREGLLNNYSYSTYSNLEHDYDLINNFIQKIYEEYDYLKGHEDEVQNYLTNLRSLLEEAKGIEQSIETKIKNNYDKLYDNFQYVFEQTLNDYFNLYIDEGLAEGSLILFKLMDPPTLEDDFKKSILSYLEECMFTNKIPYIYVEFDYIEKIEQEFNKVKIMKENSKNNGEDFDRNKFYGMLITNLIKLME